MASPPAPMPAPPGMLLSMRRRSPSWKCSWKIPRKITACSTSARAGPAWRHHARGTAVDAMKRSSTWCGTRPGRRPRRGQQRREEPGWAEQLPPPGRRSGLDGPAVPGAVPPRGAGATANLVWQTIHGRLFFYPQYEMSYFGDHFAAILFLFVPLYALWAHPLVLILGQALALAMGGLFAHRIALLHLVRDPAESGLE